LHFWWLFPVLSAHLQKYINFVLKPKYFINGNKMWRFGFTFVASDEAQYL
jgi:hypothetical protein